METVLSSFYVCDDLDAVAEFGREQGSRVEGVLYN